ncbi:MAG TPA: TIGR01777 family oxidoreductase [Candidatus Omnitrophota bacterium]|nr:TIGR01777 family oxidoreductase [Candidatus Omnitrophota bacterium]
MTYRIAISGSTGLVGSALVDHFRSNGHTVTRIIRPETKINSSEPCVVMDAFVGTIEAEKLEGHEAVIHLAGASIAGGRWSASTKRLLYASRIDTTKLLSSALAKLKNKPKVFLSASAVGYYGPHPAEETLDEQSGAGSDYLARICRDWEEATQEAQNAGIRVVHLRTGVVLSKKGGALKKMLPIFQFGLGGVLGSGEQMMSWIALDEIPLVIEHLIKNEKRSGPVNVVAPHPVSNKEFTKALGRAIKRPVVFPVPTLAIKALYGEMGETLLLSGAKILPKKLLDSGYMFRYPNIEEALKVSMS